MNQIDLQGKCVDVLKAFNNSIVTARLYPPEAPQAANAIERGYQRVKLFLDQFGTLNFVIKDDVLSLCDQILGEEILSLFPNLVVYRQLHLLGFRQLLLLTEMDRFAFGQILSVFNASAEKIAQEGGGVEYVTSLGLTDYFPDNNEEVPEISVDKVTMDSQHANVFVKVRPELLSFLYGKDLELITESEVKKEFAQRDVAIEILAGGVGHILQNMKAKKGIEASTAFPLMLKIADKTIAAEERDYIASGLGKILADSLKAPALSVLLCQTYPDGFGKSVFHNLVNYLSSENLVESVVIFREQIAKVTKIEGNGSEYVLFIEHSLLRLMKTEKGKKFLGLEKARKILHDGEKQRRKLRIETGLNALLQGDTAALNREELIEYLPAIIEQMLERGKHKSAGVILKRSAAFCLKGEVSIVQSLYISLVTVSEKLAAEKHWPLLEILIDPLVVMVRNAHNTNDVFKRAVTILQLIMQKMWENGDNKRGDEILNLFYQIRSGQIKKSSEMMATVGKIQDKGLKRANLPALLKECLKLPNDQSLSFRLILQGPIAARFLTEELIKTEESTDRIKIIDLLSYSGSFLPPIVLERLPTHMPWYGKRNLIKLLGETGSEEHADAVLPYFSHDDLRVQSEAFLCVYKIGGKKRKSLLLKALDDSAELIKVQIIASLANMCDPEVATHLGIMLINNGDYGEKNRLAILLQILDTLSRCGCQAALDTVKLFLSTKGHRSTKKITQAVWEAADKAQSSLENDLLEIRKKHVQVSRIRKNALKRVMKGGIIPPQQSTFIDLSDHDQIIRQLVTEGKTEAAGRRLLESIKKVSRAGEFARAEKLHQWLIEINPMAFNYIIQAAEIIDGEKAAAIDKNHLIIWNKLYDMLTSEEFSALYYALTNKRFKNEEIIVEQGDIQTSLYFINSGKVKLFFREEGDEVLVKTLETGQIFGATVFFEPSVWTLSAASVGITEIAILKRNNFKQWKQDFPGLEAKLTDFSRSFETIEAFLKGAERDRRQYDRYAISGKIQIMLVNNRGKPIGVSTTGELVDISEGGISYLLRIPQKDNARLLLGRKAQITLPKGEKDAELRYIVGDILAVKCIYTVENDYSVHVRFDKPMSQEEVVGFVKRGQ